MSEASIPSRAGLFSAAAFIVILALVAIIAIAKESGLLENATAVQYIGGLFSLLMIGAGNILPKRAEAPQTASRLAGWILVLGGVASLALWLLAPQDVRKLAASATALSAFAVAIVAAALHLKRGGGASSPVQHAVLHILHALMWGFAIFLADAFLDDASQPWMIVGFTLSTGLLLVLMGRFAKKGA